MSFKSLGIDTDICDALDSKGITSPFPIQEQAIPVALSGSDVIGQAKTGTGKTLGFGLPLIQALGENPPKGVQALVVVPTRELALQVSEDLIMATANRPTTVVAIYGGKAYEGQVAALEGGAQIVVGTPGRLLDLAKQKLMDLSKVTFMVLDEADEMLDLGFLPDVEKLFSLTPPQRQTMLFSATMPSQILSLARRYQNRPIHIRVSDPDEGKTKADIKQFVYRAHSLDKDEVVGRILQADGRGKTVIFVRTKRASAKLAEELIDRGFNAAPLHGDMSQDARERSMSAFREGKKEILVATEVAARGIDVDDVTHVINYSVPEDEKAYLHRIGRTGRAGKLGVAVTFVDWDDLTRWVHINRELDLGVPEPTETYSNSDHLYAELGIAPGTKGRIGRAPTQKSTQPQRQGNRSQPQAKTEAARPPRNRNRNRNYKGASKPEA
ncbi:MAG: DEAD/DEAH box helicase [Micrococcales bacterium]|nr:DEAD/DEAH box helicase [Micrococcales bacterium]MBT5398811.1 DEAD/DEAH box helicase [Micrococcales bacterium]MBT5431841.1 DEAD/DEAH box helicase [Micrococcales bacterium]MBT5848476.1 DEAD/DEAH box helicase [Micrococcales bacterium]MBT7925500.1 DEAD/DEAH box helicase [Micrococcales bacterium]